MRYILLLCICFAGLVQLSNAQSVTASAVIDTNAILIGDQLNLTVNVKADKNVNLLWPTFLDTIYQFEVVNRTEFDTIQINENQFELEQSFILTNWDSGFYPIPPIAFEYKLSDSHEKQLAETEALLVTVYSVPVDTAAGIKDIKPPIHVPMTLRELAPYIGGVFGLIAAIVVGVLLYRRYKNKKSQIVKIEPQLPAHEIAFTQLAQLKDKKLWQNNKIKKYYSELSDIIRLYIENRYKTPALEMTTYDILSSPLVHSLDTNEKDELHRILTTADLAKFAKANPLPNENELNWDLTYDFVNKTKLIQVKPTEPEKEEVNV